MPQPHYWDHVYTKLGRHEWQTEYAELASYEYCDPSERFASLPRRLLGQSAQKATDSWETTCGDDKGQRTLILGSGNSTLGEEMHDAGWSNITSIDFSDVAIEIARQRAPHMEWKTADATELAKSFGPQSFDLVIDKGLLDSMHLVGAQGTEPIAKISQGVQKVLAPGGASPLAAPPLPRQSATCLSAVCLRPMAAAIFHATSGHLTLASCLVCCLCAGRFVWLSLSAPSVWVAEHSELTESRGWASTEARRLADSYLYIYAAKGKQGQRSGGALGSARARRRR
jgi:hypothetical protein